MRHPTQINSDADRYTRAYNQDSAGLAMACEAVKANLTPGKLAAYAGEKAEKVAFEMRVSVELVRAMRKRWGSGTIEDARKAKMVKNER